MALRDHQPIILEEFNGLWEIGDKEKTPIDHFTECNNIKYIGGSSFGTRDGIGPHQDIGVPLSNILRMYNYPTDTANTILVLIEGGEIYHVVNSTTMFGPILSIPEMTDFAMEPYAGRAYITPFTTELAGDLNKERGLENEFLYVYMGDGTQARKAAGLGPTTPLTVAHSVNPGFTDPGLHIFGYLFETNSGYLSPPGGLTSFTTNGTNALDFTNVAVSPDLFVIARHVVASKVIQDFNGDLEGYQLFFIPDGTIPNNAATVLTNISFYDADLLEDASHLLDNFTEIPAGVSLCTYHNRLVLTTPFDNISVAYVSSTGEPEAINQVDGVLLFPPDGNPITNCAELRDVLYLFKRNRTGGWVDNGDEPATWPYSAVDNAMGCGVHGIATVLDSGSANIDYLIVCSYKGITLFNGGYILPELSWKISNLWINQNFKNDFWRIQIINDSYHQLIYCVLADRTLLYSDYANGFDPMKIRWSPWSFEVFVNTICFVNINELLLGCDQI